MAEIPSNDPSCDVAKRIVDTFDERVTAFAEWVWASPARTWDDIVSRALIAAEESEFDPQASLSATSADIQTALRECAYATAFQTSEQRKAELSIWSTATTGTDPMPASARNRPSAASVSMRTTSCNFTSLPCRDLDPAGASLHDLIGAPLSVSLAQRWRNALCG